MADGFKKYFNGSTMNGRANVAKATYATIALVYLFYRVRRGKAQPPAGELESTESTNQSHCVCEDKPPEPSHDGLDSECTICRDRSSGGHQRRDDCNGHDAPPSPSTPTAKATEATRPRRKCPCEDPHRHVDTAMQSPQEQVQTNVNQLDEAHPAREIIAQMQKAASRVLRNVIGAVIGDTPPNPNYGPETGKNAAEEIDSDGNCSCCIADNAAIAAADQNEDDGSDYDADSQLHQRRTSPSNTSSNSVSLNQTEQSQEQSQAPSRFRCLDDDFASEMFFENYDE